MSQRPLENIMGIVLNGGKSIRMGQDKASVEVGNKSMLRVTIDSLRLLKLDTVAAVGLSKYLLEHETDVIFLNDNYVGFGPLAGIQSALSYALKTNRTANITRQYHGMLVIPVDMPALTTKLLSELVIDGKQSGKVTCFELNGRLVHLPVYIPVDANVFRCVEELIKDVAVAEPSKKNTEAPKFKGLSLRRFLEHNHVKTIVTKDSDALININTVQDLALFNEKQVKTSRF